MIRLKIKNVMIEFSMSKNNNFFINIKRVKDKNSKTDKEVKK